MVWRWFEDCVRGRRDHLGSHNTGNLILTTVRGQRLLIDGQQRVGHTRPPAPPGGAFSLAYSVGLKIAVGKLEVTITLNIKVYE